VAEDDDAPGIDQVLPSQQVVHDAEAHMHAGGQGNQFVLAGLAVFLIPVVLGDDDHSQPGQVDGVGPRIDALGELFYTVAEGSVRDMTVGDQGRQQGR